MVKNTKSKKKTTTKTTRRKTKKRTHIAIVLDSSGSMSSMREAAIALFNSQRDVIRKNSKKGGDTKVSLVIFGENPDTINRDINFGWINNTMSMYWGNNSKVRVVHENVCVDCIPELTEQTYTPQYNTPMRDGIGKAISILEKEDDCGKDTAFLVIVITDGYENASREWTAETLSNKIVQLQNTGRWTFAVYGCDDLDLSELKSTSGLQFVYTNNVGTYKRGHDGLVASANFMADSTRTYLSSREVGITNTTSFVSDDKDVKVNADNIKS